MNERTEPPVGWSKPHAAGEIKKREREREREKQNRKPGGKRRRRRKKTRRRKLGTPRRTAGELAGGIDEASWWNKTLTGKELKITHTHTHKEQVGANGREREREREMDGPDRRVFT